MSARILTLIGWVCLTAAAIAAPPSGQDLILVDGKLVGVLGSSTAAGSGPIHADSAWAARFRTAAMLEDPFRNVINRGIGGYTTYHIMPDWFVPPPGRPQPQVGFNITNVLNNGVDAVIINLPSNDVIYGYPIEEQMSNYDTIIAEAAQYDVPVWLTTSQPRNTTEANRLQLMAVRDTTFARFGEFAIDFWTEIANPDGTINSIYDAGDGVHLNDAAHGILYSRVAAKDIWGYINPPDPVGAPEIPVPFADRMQPASPNPFRDATVLSYSLSRPGHVVLSIYDVAGRRVATVQDERVSAGSHRVPYDAASLARGVYFVRLTTESVRLSGKLTHTR